MTNFRQGGVLTLCKGLLLLLPRASTCKVPIGKAHPAPWPRNLALIRLVCLETEADTSWRQMLLEWNRRWPGEPRPEVRLPQLRQGYPFGSKFCPEWAEKLGGERGFLVMRLRYKVWLDYGGRAFGDGPARLLDEMQRTGSLRKAAAELGMSYNKAWRIIHAAEQRLNFSLLDRSVGGSLGGGLHLTPQAKDLWSATARCFRRRRSSRGGISEALLRLGGSRAGSTLRRGASPEHQPEG